MALLTAFVLATSLNAKEVEKLDNTKKVIKKQKTKKHKNNVKFESPFNKRYYKSPKYDTNGKLIKERK